MQNRRLTFLVPPPLLALSLACGGSGSPEPVTPASRRIPPANALRSADPPRPTPGPASEGRLLERQCRAVVRKLEAWRKAYPGGEVILLLGAPPDGDLRRFSRPGTFTVLLDRVAEPEGAASGEALGILTADFNALADLDLIVGHFASSFDQVGFDANVVYFTRWTLGHLLRMRGLVAPEGVFVATAMWHAFAPGPHPLPEGLSLEGDPLAVLDAAAATLTPPSATESLLPGQGLRVPFRLHAYIHERGLQDAWKGAVLARLQAHVTANLRTCFRSVDVRTECPWYVAAGDPWTQYVCRP